MGHARRFAGLGDPRWVDAMVKMIATKCTEPDNWFRWHDSGDLQGVWHLEKIAAVCARTPTVHHWLPTREYEYVAKFRAKAEIPPNLTIRLSAHMIDCEPSFPDRLRELVDDLPVSTVSSVPLIRSGFQLVEGKGSVECRAVEARDNKCGPCRACWDPRVKSVNYPQH